MFLPEILRAHGHDVDFFWDEAWIGGAPVPWQRVASHDVVIMFQSYCPHEGHTYRSLHNNVVYIPMFDQFDLTPRSSHLLTEFWKPFHGSKVLSFSTAVHVLANVAGIVSHHVRYYPKLTQSVASEGLHGFFWIRRERELGWEHIRTVLGDTRFDSFHIHLAGDPGFPPVRAPSADDGALYNITTSTWFNHRTDFEKVVQRANVFFAPRLTEGIGQSFLEAMSRGQCVIAADNPTMNEYIVHGVNGLIYDPKRLEPLDFSDAVQLGRQARSGVAAGRIRWEAMELGLVDYILTPSSSVYGGRIPHPRKVVREVRRRVPPRLKHFAGLWDRTMRKTRD